MLDSVSDSHQLHSLVGDGNRSERNWIVGVSASATEDDELINYKYNEAWLEA